MLRSQGPMQLRERKLVCCVCVPWTAPNKLFLHYV